MSLLKQNTQIMFLRYHLVDNVNCVTHTHTHLSTRDFCLDESGIFCQLFLLFLNFSTKRDNAITLSAQKQKVPCNNDYTQRC